MEEKGKTAQLGREQNSRGEYNMLQEANDQLK